MATGSPDLKKYLDRSVSVKLNGNRTVRGTLRGFDQFMNLVIEDAVHVVSTAEQHRIGQIVVRGNSVLRIEHIYVKK